MEIGKGEIYPKEFDSSFFEDEVPYNLSPTEEWLDMVTGDITLALKELKGQTLTGPVTIGGQEYHNGRWYIQVHYKVLINDGREMSMQKLYPAPTAGEYDEHSDDTVEA